MHGISSIGRMQSTGATTGCLVTQVAGDQLSVLDASPVHLGRRIRRPATQGWAGRTRAPDPRSLAPDFVQWHPQAGSGRRLRELLFVL